MYHIVKSKSKTQPFQVVLVGDNGEPLSASELLKSKQAAWKNVKAVMCSVFSEGDVDCFCLVQDDTLKFPKAYRLYNTGRKDAYLTVKPKYIAGKNPKRK